MLLKSVLLAVSLIVGQFGVTGASTAALGVRDSLDKASSSKNCGKYDILFTGLPPYHPDVLAQGYDGAVVAAGLKAQLQELVAAGYNTKELFWEPEQGVAPLAKALKDKKWDGVVIGFGIRGDPRLNSTIHFEEIVNLLREKAPKSVQVFNYSPTSTLEAVQRNFPLGDCSKTPGKNYGEEIICTVCAQ